MLAQKDSCRRFIENLAFAAFEKTAGPMSAEEADYIRKNNASVEALLDKLGTSNWIIVDTPNKNRALAREATQTITFYKDFFQQQYTRDLIFNNEDRTYYSDRSVTERAQTLIHEGLHLMAPGFTDALLGELISGKAIKGSEDERREKGSKIISDAVAVHCR